MNLVIGVLPASPATSLTLGLLSCSGLTYIIGLDELRDHGRMSWIEQERAWVAVPEDIVQVFSRAGFAECKHEMTTSRRDSRPAGACGRESTSLAGPGAPSPDDDADRETGGEA